MNARRVGVWIHTWTEPVEQHEEVLVSYHHDPPREIHREYLTERGVYCTDMHMVEPYAQAEVCVTATPS